eukprot:CAMPEP_0205946890 /NCGR_PEP_ID=MMETSP1325-20131115/69280_1 /ASSEMBLY_ACC=CAM_ASM_000708 /TAXON_ID=236786 /ORGANISM="Florenciella sp., Strain RCC1007" /LENGTH=108 /DNA_ID=CAMNT_0053317979 /DNA_START=527 /DNA_END=853 /DNA_ORIENTATION=+
MNASAQRWHNREISTISEHTYLGIARTRSQHASRAQCRGPRPQAARIRVAVASANGGAQTSPARRRLGRVVRSQPRLALPLGLDKSVSAWKSNGRGSVRPEVDSPKGT